MGRTPCCNVDGLKKGAWTSEEDQKLVSYIKEHGEGGWRTLPLKAGLQRCGKSCRLRWANYLRPDIKRGEFSPQEEHRIIELHSSLGNRWSAIARHLPKRTDNEIKNYWNTHLKKRLSSDKAPGLDQTTTQSNPKGPTTATAVAAGGEEEEEEEEEEEQQQPPPDHGHVSSSSSSTSSASAQLLNKLAAKFAPRHHRRKNNNNGTEEDREEEEEEEDGGEDEEEEEGEETGNDVVLPRGQVGSSAKLLNKMATRLAHPMHCLNTLKSILSSAAAGSIGSSMMMQRCPSTSSLHSYSTAATSASASDVISMSISNNNNNNNVATSMSNNDAPENADNQNQALAFLDDLDLDRVLNDDDWPQFDQTVHFDLDTTTAERLVQGSDNNYYINNYNNNDGGFIDLEEQPSTSAASKSTNYDHMDDYYYDNGYYGVDQQMRAATTTTTTTTTSDDAYGHQQFDYIHSLGGLLDGDDEYGRTFWNNYDDAPAAASFF